MDKIIDKIRKLLALAADGTNAHVSAEALRKAQEMMAEHGLDEAAIDRASVKTGSAASPFSVSKLKLYEKILVISICEAFGCDWVWGMNHSRSDDNSARVNFYGPHSRLQLAIYSYEVLSRQLLRARREYVQKHSRMVDDKIFNTFDTEGWSRESALVQMADPATKAAKRKMLKKMGEDFALGFVVEIKQKVVALAVGDAEMALIKSVADADADEVEPAGPKPDIGRSFYDGIEAAKNANLHRPIDGTNGPVQQMLGQTLQLTGA